MFKVLKGLLKIGTIGYGGGIATMPLMKKEFVEKQKIMTEEEFVEIIAICNILPGPFITKFCTIMGYRIKGVLGAISCVIALILPSSIMLIFILTFIKNANGQNNHITNMINAIFPVVSVILCGLTIDFLKIAKKKFTNKKLYCLLAICAVLLLILKINVVILIIASIVLCFVIPKMEGEND